MLICCSSGVALAAIGDAGGGTVDRDMMCVECIGAIDGTGECGTKMGVAFGVTDGKADTRRDGNTIGLDAIGVSVIIE
jgi:hypothetical protein